MPTAIGIGISPMFQLGATLNQTPKVLSDTDKIWAWNEFDDLTTITKDGSDLVGKWADKNLTGHDLIQNTAASKFLYSVNGLTADGIDDFMQTAAATLNAPCAIYIVLEALSWTNLDSILDGFDYGSMTLIQYGGTPSLQLIVNGDFILNTPNVNLPLNTVGLVKIKIGAIASTLQINDSAAITGNRTDSPNGLTLGINGTQLYGRYANATYKAFVMAKAALTTKEETDICTYLTDKYVLNG